MHQSKEGALFWGAQRGSPASVGKIRRLGHSVTSSSYNVWNTSHLHHPPASFHQKPPKALSHFAPRKCPSAQAAASRQSLLTLSRLAPGHPGPPPNQWPQGNGAGGEIKEDTAGVQRSVESRRLSIQEHKRAHTLTH